MGWVVVMFPDTRPLDPTPSPTHRLVVTRPRIVWLGRTAKEKNKQREDMDGLISLWYVMYMTPGFQ